MIRWVDVNPYSWYYRDVLDASRLLLDPLSDETLFSGIPYNRFKAGKGKIVMTYTSTENQIEFSLPGYVPSSDNPVYCYVEGVPVQVETQPDKVFLPTPITAGLQVTVMAMGVPDLIQSGCRVTPTTIHRGTYPSVQLKNKSQYVFDFNYHLNEIATSTGRKLKRIDLNLNPGEDVQDAMYSQVRYARNVFTIVNGVLYTSYEFWNVPVKVEYNYKGTGGQILHTSETVIPTSDIVTWNDRFFPDVTMLRSEFVSLLQRMRKNLYHRFTDRDYKPVMNNERGVIDIPLSRWYAEDVLDILNEKYLDGCYVFPLYEDNSFNPEGCITRAEAVTYLHRFIEWALERFR